MIRKLSHGADLDREDRAKLLALTDRSRRVGAREDLNRENERADDVHLIIEGFACRYKVLDDGSRSITAIMVPGDFGDLHGGILGRLDHSIATLTACTVTDIPGTVLEELSARSPRIARALWWATLVDAAVMREWLVNMGRRTADRQLAHLLCELLVRLQAVGHADENSYEFPLTQEELGDTLGLSTVHVNRVLQQLREDRLISLQGRVLMIPDVERLSAFAGFNPNYLHLKSSGPPQSGQADAP